MLKEMTKRTYNTKFTVRAKKDNTCYEKDKEYDVQIDRMSHGKYNMYLFKNSHPDAGKSYRSFDTVEGLEKDFEVIKCWSL